MGCPMCTKTQCTYWVQQSWQARGIWTAGREAEAGKSVIAPHGAYLTIGPTLIAGMDATAMDREIRKWNRG